MCQSWQQTQQHVKTRTRTMVPVTVCVPTARFAPLFRDRMPSGSLPPSSPRHRRSRTLRKVILACSGLAASPPLCCCACCSSSAGIGWRQMPGVSAWARGKGEDICIAPASACTRGARDAAGSTGRRRWPWDIVDLPYDHKVCRSAALNGCAFLLPHWVSPPDAPAAPHRAAAASRDGRRSAGAFAPAHGHYLRSATCGPAAAVAAMVQETVAHELRVCRNTSRTPVSKLTNLPF